MGVLSLGAGLPVWNGGTRIILSLIDFAIETVGEETYLIAFKTSFEHGYNHADLSVLSPSQFAEFHQIVIDYAQARVWERDGFVDGGRFVGELLDLMAARARQVMR